MEQRMTTVLSPVTKIFPKEISKATRLNTLDGKVMGLLWNTKPNGDIMLRRIQEVLSSRFKLAGVIFVEKPRSADTPAPDDMIRDLAFKADFIIASTGD
jgi:hypothetical protein